MLIPLFIKREIKMSLIKIMKNLSQKMKYKVLDNRNNINND